MKFVNGIFTVLLPNIFCFQKSVHGAGIRLSNSLPKGAHKS